MPAKGKKAKAKAKKHKSSSNHHASGHHAVPSPTTTDTDAAGFTAADSET